MDEQEKTMSRLIDCLASIDNHLAEIEDRLVDQNSALYDMIIATDRNYSDLIDVFIRHWTGRRIG